MVLTRTKSRERNPESEIRTTEKILVNQNDAELLTHPIEDIVDLGCSAKASFVASKLWKYKVN
jgi:hypothetical protein